MNVRKKIMAIAVAATLAVSSLTFSACSYLNLGFGVFGSGQSGKDFDLFTVYQQLVEQGEFSGTYSEFVKQYLQPEVTQDPSSIAQSVNAALPTTVSVWVGCEYSYTGGSVLNYTAGSGVFWKVDREKGDAYIVTNCHVIYDHFDRTITQNGKSYVRTSAPLTYSVYLYGMEYGGSYETTGYPDYSISASVVGYSMDNDIAVLKVTGSEVIKNSLAQAAVIGNSDNIFVGDDVFVIGNPMAKGLSATEGIISVESTISVNVSSSDGRYTISPRSIRFDAATNEGNSGGGLFNAKGELIGINYAGPSESDIHGVGYALPISTVKGLVNSIIYNCDGNSSKMTTTKAQLGITTMVSSSEQYYDEKFDRITSRQTIAVEKVTLGSAAYGKLRKGDILLKATLGGETIEINHNWQVSDLLWNAKVGDTITLTVLRDNKEQQISITFFNLNFTSVK